MRLRGKKAIFNYDDTWSLDATLSPIICAGLIRFREVIVDSDVAGVPLAILDPEASNEDGQYLEEELDSGFDKWLCIIDEMIYAFDHVADDYALSDFNRKRVARGHELFGKYYSNLWW